MSNLLPTMYRPCVGVMLINDSGQVFTGQRIDKVGDFWQMPQGGIEEGEEVEAAAYRELYEETGVSKDVTEIIAIDDEWRKYDLPTYMIGKLWGGKYRGQIQKWILMGFLGTDSDICLDLHTPEFSTWRWQSLELLPHVIVPFKRGIYTQVMEQFKLDIASYVAEKCA